MSTSDYIENNISLLYVNYVNCYLKKCVPQSNEFHFKYLLYNIRITNEMLVIYKVILIILVLLKQVCLPNFITPDLV